jgi:hypothetical protein
VVTITPNPNSVHPIADCQFMSASADVVGQAFRPDSPKGEASIVMADSLERLSYDFDAMFSTHRRRLRINRKPLAPAYDAV